MLEYLQEVLTPNSNVVNCTQQEGMRSTTGAPIAPFRILQHDAMLIFGLGHRHTHEGRAGIPSQWERFLLHSGNIPGQVGRIAYGVICNNDNANDFDYICGVEVAEFPAHPREFMGLRIPRQTYAVFLHPGHISTVGATCSAIWNQGLPDSGYKAVHGPWFERYPENFDGRTGLGGLEIWIPIIP